MQKEGLTRSNVKIWECFLEKAKILRENYENRDQNPKEKGSGQKRKAEAEKQTKSKKITNCSDIFKGSTIRTIEKGKKTEIAHVQWPHSTKKSI